jgi:hypothetical protein
VQTWDADKEAKHYDKCDSLGAPRKVADAIDVDPEDALGAPNGRATKIKPGSAVSLTRFEGRFYSGLVDLLNGQYGGDALPGFPPRRVGVTEAGDAVTTDKLSKTDVIAFDLNGGHPGLSGGWESCNWLFEDESGASISVPWKESDESDDDGPVIANGSTDGDRYSRFFAITPPTAEESAGSEPNFVISYILFALPTLNVASPEFTITLKHHGVGTERTPDLDAIGVIACARS